MSRKIIRRQYQQTVLSSEKLHPVLEKIYSQRGITSTDELERHLAHLLPYHDLMHIDKAVNLLYTMLTLQKRMLIIGDFDADGATSSALAVSALQALGAKEVSYLVPNRFEYGYGLTPEIVTVALKYQPDLIITVDNGISSCAGVLAAKQLGIKVLVTDHHLPGRELPEADAIVNPNQNGDKFLSKNLAGVGVIFYVMLALRSFLRTKNWFVDNNIAEPNMADFLDLVALGTVADVVPLDKNNRILVHQGLSRIRAGLARPGIKALITIANRNQYRLCSTDLAFALGPRLNAAGRLDDMSLGIDCLLAKDINNALDKAKILDELNQERRFIEQDMQQQALNEIAKLKLETKNNLPLGVCLYDETWHQGVIGILAGRIKDRFHRPVIAFANGSEGEIKGSARSIEGLHIRDVLEAIATKNPDLITKFGGHAMAAGLTLPKQNYERFANLFTKEVQARVTEDALNHVLLSDGELKHEDLTIELADLIREAGPWGQAFPEPIFDGRFQLVEQRIVGAKHLKMTLKCQQKLLDAIAFNVDVNQWPNHRCHEVNIAYRLDVNEYRGIRNVQLMIEHLEPASVAAEQGERAKDLVMMEY
jgi:single-stranded-DNA-specific exonuclease